MLALTGTSILCAVVLGLSVGMGLRFGIGIGILVVFLAFWALVFRCDEAGSARAVAVLIVTIAVSGALTTVDTSLGFFQAFAYPAA